MGRFVRLLELQDPAHARLLSMEGLRGFAVLLVFLQHYSYQSMELADFTGIQLVVMKALRAYGNLGVELFFVLSGYLIYGTLVRRRQAFLPFMGRRLRRIYPAFLVAFTIFLLLHFAAPGDPGLPSSTAALLAIVENLLLLPGLFPIQPIMAVAWTLSYEMFFYMATAAWVSAFGLDRWTPRSRIILLVALSLVFLAACYVHRPMPFRMMPFFAGMFLAEGVGVVRGRVPAAVGLVAPVAALVTCRVFPSAPYLLLELMQTAAFFALCAACFNGSAARPFTWAPLRWLGNMSYSYYLLHGLTLIPLSVLARHWLGTNWPTAPLWLLLAPVFALSLLPPFLLFVFVERPISLRPSTRPGMLPAV